MKIQVVLTFVLVDFAFCARLRKSSCRCGERKERPTARIVAGSEAAPHEFPWMVGLLETLHQEYPTCGGSLISDRHILTAAHCIKPGHMFHYATIGDHDTASVLDGGRKKLIMPYTTKDVIHPKYREPTDAKPIPVYDFAMLTLVAQIRYQFYEFARPICLPNPRNFVQAGRAVVAGWGKQSFAGEQSSVLLKADLDIVTNRMCSRIYKAPPNDSVLTGINRRHLCAGMGVQDACQGDSGGPLMAKRPVYDMTDEIDRYEIIGVTSFGHKCGEEGYPGGYARVTKVLGWIFNELQKGTGVVTVCDGLFGQWYRDLQL